MCGIAGFTHRDRVVSSSYIRRATHSLVHRGPDQQGIYESAHISLGAVRLKIIDLLSGDQPMHSEDSDVVIVFNGEIYNHAEIRRRAGARGTVHVPQRYRGGAARLLRVGHAMFFTTARHVRPRLVDRIPETLGAGARPHGDQAAVLLPRRRRALLRLGTQSDSGAPRGRAADRPRRAELLPVPELCPVPAHAGGGH